MSAPRNGVDAAVAEVEEPAPGGVPESGSPADEELRFDGYDVVADTKVALNPVVIAAGAGGT